MEKGLVTAEDAVREVAVPQDLITQINSIVSGMPVQKRIERPGCFARCIGKSVSIGAKFLIWLDASVYSMLAWWGSGTVEGLHFPFHVSLMAAVAWGLAYFGVANLLSLTNTALAIGLVVAGALAISLPLQFFLYAFEFSLMGKPERRITSFNTTLAKDVTGTDGNGRAVTHYTAGAYAVDVYNDRPKMHRCAYYWPMLTFFAVTECVAHFLLVVRDYALGNSFGTFVLLPEDWVEFYKEVPLKDYKSFVPEHFKRRLEQVMRDYEGETFVLIPFGLMPGCLPAIDSISAAKAKWEANLAELQRPKGDPVLAVKLKNQTRFGRMLVVGHWMTLATLQKSNLLFHHFQLEPKRLEAAQHTAGK